MVIRTQFCEKMSKFSNRNHPVSLAIKMRQSFDKLLWRVRITRLVYSLKNWNEFFKGDSCLYNIKNNFALNLKKIVFLKLQFDATKTNYSQQLNITC